MKLVTKEFKAPKKRQTVNQRQLEELQERVRDLENDLANERERADEAVDKYESLSEEVESWISPDQYSIRDIKDALNMLENIGEAHKRADLVPSAAEERSKLIEELLEVI